MAQEKSESKAPKIPGGDVVTKADLEAFRSDLYAKIDVETKRLINLLQQLGGRR